MIRPTVTEGHTCMEGDTRTERDRMSNGKKYEADRQDTKTQPHRPISLAAVGIAYWLSNES